MMTKTSAIRTLKIAQHFNAGLKRNEIDKSNQGRQDGAFVPRGTGLEFNPTTPALKRWAIIPCFSG